jgi:hypothetical protein
VDTVIGAVPKATLEGKIKQHLSSPTERTDLRPLRPLVRSTFDMPGTLYIVATPLGNLGTSRPGRRRWPTPVVAAEDTRRTGACSPTSGPARLLSYHAHSEPAAGPCWKSWWPTWRYSDAAPGRQRSEPTWRPRPAHRVGRFPASAVAQRSRPPAADDHLFLIHPRKGRGLGCAGGRGGMGVVFPGPPPLVTCWRAVRPGRPAAVVARSDQALRGFRRHWDELAGCFASSRRAHHRLKGTGTGRTDRDRGGAGDRLLAGRLARLSAG